MPLYDYLCASCKKTTEVLQGFNEKPLKICPHCGGKLKKLASAPAIQFKGSGWYVTDYAGKGKSPAEGPAAKPAESGSEKSSDAKKTEKSSEKPSEKAPKKGSGSKKD